MDGVEDGLVVREPRRVLGEGGDGAARKRGEALARAVGGVVHRVSEDRVPLGGREAPEHDPPGALVPGVDHAVRDLRAVGQLRPPRPRGGVGRLLQVLRGGVVPLPLRLQRIVGQPAEGGEVAHPLPQGRPSCVVRRRPRRRLLARDIRREPQGVPLLRRLPLHEQGLRDPVHRLPQGPILHQHRRLALPDHGGHRHHHPARPLHPRPQFRVGRPRREQRRLHVQPGIRAVRKTGQKGQHAPIIGPKPRLRSETHPVY